MSEKDLDWYREALHSAVESRERVVQSYLQAHDQLLEAQTRLAAIRVLCSKRETAAEQSLERMHGGAPFPATLAVAEVRVILDSPIPTEVP